MLLPKFDKKTKKQINRYTWLLKNDLRFYGTLCERKGRIHVENIEEIVEDDAGDKILYPEQPRCSIGKVWGVWHTHSGREARISERDVDYTVEKEVEFCVSGLVRNNPEITCTTADKNE